jgi:hypothetical protein
MCVSLVPSADLRRSLSLVIIHPFPPHRRRRRRRRRKRRRRRRRRRRIFYVFVASYNG